MRNWPRASREKVCTCVHSFRLCLHERHDGICNYMWGINILEASQGAWLVYESQFKPRVMTFTVSMFL